MINLFAIPSKVTGLSSVEWVSCLQFAGFMYWKIDFFRILPIVISQLLPKLLLIVLLPRVSVWRLFG
ncbi:hypothetical protein BTA35_0202555 [Oceanospirillum linum]|uniref:Uncharacterized protein n=1 Tax=Oceanospirillum linum TaxID=966 RepID=A0A1T1HFB1_OCELI|nr:hypothetical protein BTA35_0202555 [Oceanospirillum linum]